MNHFFIAATCLSWVIVLIGCWLGWQLLRQNGRMLLRLDALEQWIQQEGLDEAESGTDGKGNSLARSRINRDGLKAGTLAPDFRLPRVDGGELTLQEFRGRRVLLVFSDPQCAPCNYLAPQLEKIHREQSEIALVMISRRDTEANRAKITEYGLTFPILLQKQWEISRLYGMFATPIGYLIDEAGVIVKDVAVGVGPILELVSDSAGTRAGNVSLDPPSKKKENRPEHWINPRRLFRRRALQQIHG